MNSTDSDWSNGWQSDDSIPSLGCLVQAVGKGPGAGKACGGGTLGAAAVVFSGDVNRGGTLGAAAVGFPTRLEPKRSQGIAVNNRFDALRNANDEQITTQVQLGDYINVDKQARKSQNCQKNNKNTKAEIRKAKLQNIKDDNERYIKELDIDLQVEEPLTKAKLVNAALEVWENRDKKMNGNTVSNDTQVPTPPTPVGIRPRKPRFAGIRHGGGTFGAAPHARILRLRLRSRLERSGFRSG